MSESWESIRGLRFFLNDLEKQVDCSYSYIESLENDVAKQYVSIDVLKARAAEYRRLINIEIKKIEGFSGE